MSISYDREQKDMAPKINIFRKIQGTELYAFTVKILKNPKNADEKSYEPFFKVLYTLTSVLCFCGEADSRSILHYHGVIRIPFNFYRKSLCIKGFHLKLKKIYNLYGWVEYCFKNDIYHCFENVKILKSKEL